MCSMVRCLQRPNSGGVHFAGGQRDRRIAVDKRHTSSFLRHRQRQTCTRRQARRRTRRRHPLPWVKRPRECRSGRQNSAGNRRRSRQWRVRWRKVGTLRWGWSRDLHSKLLRATARAFRAIVEGKEENAKPWWMPLKFWSSKTEKKNLSETQNADGNLGKE